MSDVIVLVTKGKSETVESAIVRIFPSRESAERYCSAASTGKIKYWTSAEVVGDGQEVEICQPSDEL